MEEVTDYLARIMRARELTGVEQSAPPTPEQRERVRVRARAMKIEAQLQQVVDDDGYVVWELRVETGRGDVAYRRERREEWEDFLTRAGFGVRRDGT